MSNKDDLIREYDTNYGVTDDESIKCDYSPDGNHNFVPSEDEIDQVQCVYCNTTEAR